MITGSSPSSSSQTGSTLGCTARTSTRRDCMSSTSRAISKSKPTSKSKLREKIESPDRMDNNFDKLLHTVGYLRTKHESRKVKIKVNYLVDAFGKLRFANHPPGFMPAFRIVLQELTTLNAQANLNRAQYTIEFKSSVQTLLSDQGIFILKAAAESANLFIKPNAQPIRSREEAEEEVKSLKRALKKKDEQLKEKDEHLKAIVKANSFMNLANLQLGDPDEDASFTTEDTGMVSPLALPMPLPLLPWPASTGLDPSITWTPPSHADIDNEFEFQFKDVMELPL